MKNPTEENVDRDIDRPDVRDGAQSEEGAAEVSAEANAEEDEIPEVEPLTELEAAVAERDEMHEKWLRAQADFQNLRRRKAEDIEAATARAKAEVLGEAVTILDYLDMALSTPVESDDAKNLKTGIEMTRMQMQALFDRLNVRPIDATGMFDPKLHQAVSTVTSQEHEPGTIVEIVRGGWLMGESVLRFAQVRVAAEPDDDDVAAEAGEPEHEV